MEFLTRLQRNELWQAVTASGLADSDFTITLRSDNLADDVSQFIDEIRAGYIIRHTLSSSTFNIIWRRNSGGILALGQFGDDPWAINHTSNFDGIVEQARSWAARIQDWMETPDLWASMPDSAAIPGELSPDSDNAPFAPEEQALISGQLREIAESIKMAHDLTVEQSKQVDEKFAEAEKASRRMGRKDWGLLFGGAVFSLILSDIITPGIAGNILMMIEHGIGHLFGSPPVGGIMSGGQG